MNRRPDPVERALGALRDDEGLELPPPELERRLRERHAELAARRPRVPRRLAAVALVLATSGVALAASGGLAWLGRWWYALEVDGQRTAGSVDGAGERTFTFETVDGGLATVRVLREPTDAGATRTRIEFQRSGDAGVEHEEAEEVVVGEVAHERLPVEALGGAPPVLEGLDVTGRAYALYLLPDGSGASRVLVHRLGDGSLPVEELARVPVVLGRRGSAAEVVEQPEGGFAIQLADGGGRELRLEWTGADRVADGATELATPDGRVRVRVDGPLDQR